MTQTSLWFNKNPGISSHVTSLLKRQFPLEDFEVLLSEVNYWISIWCKKGTCDEYILAGRPPSAAILKVWVAQKLSHRLYRDGKDALQRERKGVRTQMEIRRRVSGAENFVHPQTLLVDTDAPLVHRVVDEDGISTTEYIDTTQNVVEMMEEKDKLQFVQDLVRVKRARAADRYARFCDHLLKGRSKEEAALLEGVSELRVTHIYQRVRNDLKDAPMIIEVALRLLEELIAEPWSTSGELEDSVSDENTTHALNFLVIRGLVAKGSGDSFAPTNAGLKAAKEGALI